MQLAPEIGVFKELDDFVREEYIPVHMMLEVSRRCNIACVHCYNVKDRAHLSLKQIDMIFGQLRDAGCLFLTLTGGELFAHPEVDQILYLAREYGFDIRMITNATLITKEKAKVLADVAPSEIGVSLLGATACTHDNLARVKGSYEKTIQGIKNCLELELPVHLKCTLMKENIGEYKDVMELAKSLGIVYMIDPVVTPRDDRDVKNLKHRLDDKLLEEFYMDYFESNPAEEEVTLIPKTKGLPCDAGTSFGSISAEGHIYPCVQLPKKVGNVFETTIKEVWNNSDTLYKIRNIKKDEFSSCSNCSGECNHCAGLAYLETGDMFGPSSTGCLTGKLYKKFKAQKEGKEYVMEPCGPQCTCC
jgi:MoaA/NifB/PqqE/SkfB family radical SAM enzyme